MAARQPTSLLLACLVHVAAAQPASDAAVGREIYRDLCAACHGRDMAHSGLAPDLRKFPKQDQARFESTVLNGKGTAMPPWRNQLSAQDVKALWDYVLAPE